MKRLKFFTLLAILGLVLAGCQPAQPPAVPAATELLPSAPAFTPTVPGTVMWFPPTRTPTTMPTLRVVPTSDQRSGLGDMILQDDFTNPNQWSAGQTAAGAVTFGEGELTLAAPGVKGYLISLRNGTNLSDYYLEITSNLSLCRGDDNYGLLLRALSAQDYYRFAVACNGQVRVERVKNGKVALLQDWVFSGQVPPGSPLVLRLGVWMVRGEMHFFINDVYQFAAGDPVLNTGTIGVFARSNGSNPLTVSFSDLKVTAIDLSQVVLPSPTPLPSATVTRTLQPQPTYPGPKPSSTPVFQHAAPTASPRPNPSATYTPVFMRPPSATPTR